MGTAILVVLVAAFLCGFLAWSLAAEQRRHPGGLQFLGMALFGFATVVLGIVEAILLLIWLGMRLAA